MITFGDQSRATRRADVLAALDGLLRDGSGSALDRHTRLVEALVGLGQVAQADADREADALGRDGFGPAHRAAMDLTRAVAGLVGRSWASGFADQAPAPDALLAGLAALDPGRDPHLILREPEGYACYALYPEAFWQAAAGWRGRPDTQVIGIRSIGTSLAAIVAAALGAPTPVTVRPVGHPFARRLELDPDLARRFDPGGTFAVVDEGPGLSGSSFGAVADRLDRIGVDRSRVVFFPSHANGPGPQAGEALRRRWHSTRCVVTSFEDLVLAPARPEQGLEAWVRDLTGPLTAAPADVAGGRWRDLGRRPGAARPPADAFAERRKFLLRGGNGAFLLKFTGLGRGGRERFAMRRVLAEAGFALPPSGWRHGFTVERWRDDCQPIESARVPRTLLVERLGAYLGFRAARLPAEGRGGATADALLAMLVANAGEALGREAGEAFATWAPRMAALQAAAVPVVTDNRLHAWEWLVTPDGGLVKTDAVDHHAGHDLVGCQDIAWDLAGAAVEFDLAADEVAAVGAAIGHARGDRPDPALLRFHRAAYPAFQLGLCRLAAGRNPDSDASAWRAQEARYAAALARGLAAGAP